ncbi:hypothetical protein ACFX2A_008632 [Malus domestica]
MELALSHEKLANESCATCTVLLRRAKICS